MRWHRCGNAGEGRRPGTVVFSKIIKPIGTKVN
jgi:hypothetical protein